MSIQQEIEKLTLSYFKTINSEITEENGLYKISIPEKYQNYFRSSQISLTFDEKVATEQNCELINPGNKVLFQIITNCCNQGPITLKQTKTHTDNIVIRYHFFVDLSGIHHASKLFSIDIDLKTLQPSNVTDELEPGDFSLNDKLIPENITKSYDVALEELKQQSEEMKNQFVEKSNSSFESDFKLFCSRYDSEMKELDDAINKKEEVSGNSDVVQKFRFDTVKKIERLRKEKNSLVENVQNKHQIEVEYELVATEIILC